MAELTIQPQMKKSKLIILLIVVIIIVLGVGYYLLKNYTAVLSRKAASQPKVSTYGNQLPKGFLSDLPIEANIALEKSYSADYGQNTIQRTISYYSSESITNNYLVFSDYLRKNNWQIADTSQTLTNIGFLYATRDGNILSISLEEKEAGVLVTISYLEKKQ